MSTWLNHHLQAIKLVLSRMRSNLLSSFLICLAVGVAMSLPGLFYLGVDNLSRLSDEMQKETEISLFLSLDATTDDIAKIDRILAENTAIKEYHLVTRDEAWQQLQEKSQDNENISSAISQLGKNPLPDAFFIQAKSADPETLETLKKTLQSIPGVEHAILNSDWAKRLASLLSIGKKLVFFITALLALMLLVIIGNTVRMQILTQKAEIEVSYLIGATNSFIRTPFLYAGILYGLFGGLLSVLFVAGIIQTFNYSIIELSSLYDSDFSLSMMNFNLYSTMISFAAFIGWLGSYIAVSRAISAVKIS